MANNYTYTLTLLDKMSNPMKTVKGASMDVIEKLGQLTNTQKKFESMNKSLEGSLVSLRAKMEMLQQERDLIAPANFKDIKRYNKEINKLRKDIEKWDKVGVESPFEFLNASAIADQLQMGFDGIAQQSTSFINFDQSIADLSAITGIAGKDLEHLSDVARKTGADSGLGAVQASEAFKYLASQIDVSKIGINGLTELQEKAITLAQASGMTMGDSANALAGTINQFGLSAAEASRVINVLAAGSKYGAAEIPELAQSFKVVGAAANAAGLSVESTAGAIEVLSKNNLKGAEAGTALRNIVLKMQTALGYDFTKTSLSDALDDLKPKLNDATYLSKLFGMENVAAAQFLIGNARAVEEMTARVTDSNVAQEQAAIRTETVQATMERCRAKIEDLKIGLFGLFGSTAGYITVLSEQAVMISQMVPLFMLFGKGIKTIANSERLRALFTKQSTAATVASTSAINTFTIAEKIKTLFSKQGAIATMFATAKQWLFNSALYACPLVWIALAIGAVVAAVVVCWNKFEGFRRVILGTWGVIKEFGRSLINSIVAPFQQILKGISGVGSAIVSLIKGDFKEAAAAAKAGFKDIGEGVINGSPIGVVYNTVNDGNYKEAWNRGAQAGSDSFVKSQTVTKGVDILTPQTFDATPLLKTPHVNNNFVELPDKITNTTKMPDDNVIQDITESSSYLTATRKLSPMNVTLNPTVAATKKLNSSSNATQTVQNKIDDKRQLYEPKKNDYLHNILLGVRKIAALIALPATMTLAARNANATSVNDFSPIAKEQRAPIVKLPNIALPPDVRESQFEVKREKNNFISESTTIKDTGKVVRVEKVCDQIVINIQNMDNKGAETIKEEILKILNELGDE